MADQPDFEKLRAERNASVNAAIRKAAAELGVEMSEVKSTFNPCACYCACASGGPCEHKWDGKVLEFESGWTTTCSRCGATSMSHDMRCM